MHTASILAMLANVNRSKGPAKSMQDFHPYRLEGASGGDGGVPWNTFLAACAQPEDGKGSK